MTDHLGTVRDIVDSAGNLINTITYDSFGQILQQTNAAAGDRFTYTGREYDAELGLYYYRARYYDPVLGRFLSQDPLGFAAGDANLYRYVGNNVLHATDPSGNLATIEKAALIGASLGGTFGAGCSFLEFWAEGDLNNTRAWQSIASNAFFGALNGFAIGGGLTMTLLVQSLAFKAVGALATAYFTTNSFIHRAVSIRDAYNGYRAGRANQGKLLLARSACGAVEVFSIVVGAARLRPHTKSNAANVAGQLGEAAVRALYRIGKETAIRVNGRLRKPDGLKPKVISEVKNRQTVSLDAQLRDFIQFAKDTQRRFDLYVRRDSFLTKPLQDAVLNGDVNLRHIP